MKPIFLMGPTASGKTAIALELANRFPVEIISVDSAQVFRHMNIGTAKPDPETLSAFPHHLIDIIDPVEHYSAGIFREDAARLISEISGRGKIPLLVGGTMLYFKALSEGLNELPGADRDTRAKIDDMAKRLGWPALHEMLAKVDPATSRRLEPTDSQRIQRALEIWMLTQTPMSRLIERQKEAPDFDFIRIALVPSDRSALHKRIESRFLSMLDAGLIEETESLRMRFDLSPEMPSMRCVGYRQTWQFLQGRFGRKDLAEKGIAATRQLAKRQLTWLRGMGEQVTNFDCLDPQAGRDVNIFLHEAFGG